jgi:hypothetical protein
MIDEIINQIKNCPTKLRLMFQIFLLNFGSFTVGESEGNLSDFISKQQNDRENGI